MNIHMTKFLTEVHGTCFAEVTSRTTHYGYGEAQQLHRTSAWKSCKQYNNSDEVMSVCSSWILIRLSFPYFLLWIKVFIVSAMTLVIFVDKNCVCNCAKLRHCIEMLIQLLITRKIDLIRHCEAYTYRKISEADNNLVFIGLFKPSRAY